MSAGRSHALASLPCKASDGGAGLLAPAGLILAAALGLGIARARGG